MPHSDFLLTIAEVAVAIAGFASLVTVLSRDRSDHFELDVSRLRGMLLYSAYAVLFALFPFVPHALGLSDAAVWRMSSGIFGVSLLVYVVRVVRTIAHLRSLVSFNLPLVYVIRGLTWSAVAVLLVNALLPRPELNGGLYLFSLLCVTIAGGAMFLRAFFAFVSTPAE